MHKREFDVRIIKNGKHTVLVSRSGRRLKELLSNARVYASLPCGGNGRCGKCVVSFINGAPEPTDADKRFLSGEEIAAGKRILCRCILDRECTIMLDGGSEDDIVAKSVPVSESCKRAYDRYAVAVDLGTTTIAAALVGVDSDKNESHVLKTASGINHQRQFGTDVISRIDAASDTETASKLRTLVQADVTSLLKELVKEVETGLCEIPKISEIAVAGNTTMLHLLKGYDTDGLGRYPYKPVSTAMEEADISELLGEKNALELKEFFVGTRITLLPGVSAFVGADIVAGIYDTGMTERPGEKVLFMDLGTNGELAYFDGARLTVASTAAGPVFEGGGISCGVASVPGAISHVEISSGFGGELQVRYATIEEVLPIGLCGTGVIEAVAELVRNEIVDSNGLLDERFFEDGFVIDKEWNIRIKQSDIRNVQLAKAAIRAGILKLLSGDEPDRIIIAGGFGASLDLDKLKFLKLLPEGFNKKTEIAGNAALKGCIRYLKEASQNKLEKIAEGASEMALAMEEDFGETYLEALSF